jgi:Glycosyl hydrolase family 65, C-terminal domain/Glycosyl hydrolase family 65 central catalytic domain
MASVAARLGYSEMALRYFRQTAAIDLADTHVAIDGGVHIAALGGVWLTAVFGFAGLSMHGDALAFDPQLPASWRSLGFRLQWRSRHLKVRIEQAKQILEVTLEAGEPMTLLVSGERHELRRDQMLQVLFGRPFGSKARHQSRLIKTILCGLVAAAPSAVEPWLSSELSHKGASPLHRLDCVSTTKKHLKCPPNPNR